MNSTSTNTNMTGMVKAPGNDSLGGGCLVDARLPRVEDLVPDGRDVFLAGLDADGAYNKTAWARCCARGEVFLAGSCYPYCDIPADTLRGGGGGTDKDKDRSKDDKDRVARDMKSCIGNIRVSTVFLANHTSAAAAAAAAQLPTAGLPKLLTIGMVLAYMMM
ncbi:hypothetical protein IF1G_09614 [Cordyceps javanica]|uniref:Uncharacterized protein n=1 Tax=Cordyceps javanica TaxID=43265 RepID=A0A545UQ11_9HYPO|nr:hypothetical protein IF1G_09614 [Cordyceps javanica]TQW03666.1 hypothetical protein IF2G_08964 [Cordyceps javanica]